MKLVRYFSFQTLKNKLVLEVKKNFGSEIAKNINIFFHVVMYAVRTSKCDHIRTIVCLLTLFVHYGEKLRNQCKKGHSKGSN